ncbi:MAG TPA: O-antigen ligase family protein [Thiobacillus sp.]|nr:O-antigen ligase family protein [Thiobacillus sp.]HQT70697.1 O-antigen ligase family protein [Thiobacillus sp.]
MRDFWLKTPAFSIADTSKASLAAFFLLFVFALSLPPKWASLHLAGLLLVFSVGLARRSDWRTPAMRTFLLCTALWLVPVLVTAGLQHALGIASATEWKDLPVLVLRMLGIGLGIIVLVQRGFLTLYSATFALLSALSIHVGAGLIDLLAEPSASLTAWRELRINGLVFNPNPFGMFMAITAILSVGLLRNLSHRPVLWVALIAALLCVWVSGSRGAILTTVAGFVVLFPPDNRQRLFVYFGSGALMAAVYLYVTLYLPALYSGSDSERMIAFSFSLEKIRMAPWLGWGIGAYEHFPDRVGPNAPHNMWLDLVVSSGLVALLGGLLSAGLLIVRLYRQSQPAAQLALAVFVAALVAGTLEYSILDSTHFRGVWVLVVALACCTLNEPCGAQNGVSLGGEKA